MAGAVVEAPVFGEIAVGLLAALAWIVCLGLAYAYRNTFGWFLERLAEILPAHHWYFPVDLRGAVRGINHDFLTALTYAAEKSEYAMGYLFHGAAVLQEWASREMLHLANETLADIEWLAHVHVPNSVKWALRLAVPPLLIAHLVKLAVEAELPHLIKITRTTIENPVKVLTAKVTIPYLSQWDYLHRHWKALLGALAIAGALPWPHEAWWLGWRTKLRELDIDRIHTWRRLHRLEKLLGVTAFAGAMAAVLGLPNWRCLTRGNIGRSARMLCGVPAHLLEGLLAVLADIWVLENICVLIGPLEVAAKDIGSPLIAALTEVGAGLCKGSIGPPATLQVPPLYLPPLAANAPGV